MPARAAGVSPAQAGRTLTVGLLLTNPPFVRRAEGGGFTGYAFDLWSKIAQREHWPCRYVVYTQLSDGLDAVVHHRADVFVTNLSITSARREVVEFSQPYFNSGLQIILDERQERAANDLWSGLVANGHVRVFIAGALLIVLAAVLLTLAERRFRFDEEFPEEWLHGFATAVYTVCSVVFTGKSNHKPLPGPFGKFVATSWVVAGVATVAYVTSSVTSVMTANTIGGAINGPADLAHRRVGTKGDSSAESYLRSLNLNVTAYPDIEKAIAGLEAGQVRAVVFDFPTLRAYATEHPNEPLELVGPVFENQAYGFAVPLGSPLRRPIDIELLELQESGYVDALKNKYFGSN